MMCAAILFCLPMFVALLAVIFQAVGDIWCMLAFLCLTLSVLIFLPVSGCGNNKGDGDGDGKARRKPSSIEPQTHELASQDLDCRSHLSLGLKCVATIFLVIFVFVNYVRLSDEQRESVKQTIGDANPEVLMFAVVLDIFGKAYMALIFCCDLMLDMVCSVVPPAPLWTERVGVRGGCVGGRSL